MTDNKEMLLENIEEGLVTVNISGQITYSNNAAKRILGIDKNIVGTYFQSKEWQQLDRDGNPYPADQLPLSIALREERVVSNIEHQVVATDGERKWLSVNAGPLYDDGKRLIGGIASFRDVTGLKFAEAELKLNETRLQTILDIFQHSSETIQGFLDYALEQAISLSGSKIGYIYHYSEERKEFILNTWSKDVLPACSVVNPSTCYSLEKTGIWGEAVRQRRAIIINNFESPNPLKKGMPEGHVPLKKFLTIPVFKEQTIVGVVGLANKETDYTESDMLQISLLMEAVWKVVDQKKAEEKVKSLLAEKELILKEVHHRIKNNMLTLTSLFALQASNLENPTVIAALEDPSRRVESMMMLYSKMYQTTNFTAISVAEYLPELINEIVSNFCISATIKVDLNIEDFILDVNKMQPLGIIINELITNSMKYAFDEKTTGELYVSVTTKDNRVFLVVEDNGCGIPESINFENSTGFGLILVKGLTKQLNGTIQLERGNGCRFVMEFER